MFTKSYHLFLYLDLQCAVMYEWRKMEHKVPYLCLPMTGKYIGSNDNRTFGSHDLKNMGFYTMFTLPWAMLHNIWGGVPFDPQCWWRLINKDNQSSSVNRIIFMHVVIWLCDCKPSVKEHSCAYTQRQEAALHKLPSINVLKRWNYWKERGETDLLQVQSLPKLLLWLC